MSMGGGRMAGQCLAEYVPVAPDASYLTVDSLELLVALAFHRVAHPLEEKLAYLAPQWPAASAAAFANGDYSP